MKGFVNFASSGSIEGDEFSLPDGRAVVVVKERTMETVATLLALAIGFFGLSAGMVGFASVHSQHLEARVSDAKTLAEYDEASAPEGSLLYGWIMLLALVSGGGGFVAICRSFSKHLIVVEAEALAD